MFKIRIIEIFRLKSLSEQKFETRDFPSLESNSRFLPNFDDQNGINKAYYSLKIGLKKNPIEEIVLTKLFEKAWNMNFFLSHKGIPFSSISNTVVPLCSSGLLVVRIILTLPEE